MAPQEPEEWASDKESLIRNHGQCEEQRDLAEFSKELARSSWNKGPTRGQWLLYILISAHITLLILYIVLYSKYLEVKSGMSCGDLFPSLARSQSVKYETRPLTVKIHGNEFVGDPRPELESAWHELFEDIRIRVSREDLEYYNLSSIPLADGSGYAAELGVHHELHCLKKIRHWIYKDHYLTNETAAELVEWKAHIDHCLEMMRVIVMCRGDPSLSTFEYLPGNPPALTAVAKGHHQCVNWQGLLGWVRARSFPIFEEGVLQTPDNIA